MLDAELLTPNQLAKFTDVAFQTGMEPFLKINDPDQLEQVEMEIVGGIVLEAPVLQKLKDSPKWEEIRTSQHGKIPVLIDNFIPSDEALRRVSEEDGPFFILTDSWLSEEEPVASIKQFIENIRKWKEKAG